VVDLADSTAYNTHDIEDGLIARMFSEAEIAEEVALWRGAVEAVELRHPGFLDATSDRNLRVKRLVNEMLKICINDLIAASSRRLAELAFPSPEDARAHDALVIAHSPEIGAEVAELSKFLYARFYRHPHLAELTQHAQATLALLFHAYVSRPEQMVPWYQQWVERAGLHRKLPRGAGRRGGGADAAGSQYRRRRQPLPGSALEPRNELEQHPQQ